MSSGEFCIVYMKEADFILFQKELSSYIRDKDIEVYDLQRIETKVLFSLQGNGKQIKAFLEEFAPKWYVREMGVSEFARVMEVSNKEAIEWYDLISKYRNMLFKQGDFETTLLSKIRPITDIEKVQYLNKHFQGRMGELIEERISYLQGKESSYVKWINHQVEKQELIAKLEGLQRNSDTVVIPTELFQEIEIFIKERQ